jgi:hypothetical protein
MKLTDTIDKFIDYCEGEMEDLSWHIREETNFEDNSIDWLSNEWDEKAKHLENLKQIKSILQSK